MGFEEDLTVEEGQPSEMLAIAWQGYADALKRHDEVRHHAIPKRAFISTAECLYWAATIDEQLWAWPDYEQAKGEVPGGHLLAGLRYARNLQTHQLPLTLRRTNGVHLPVRLPAVLADVVWMSADDLPLPDRTNRYTPEQREAYQRHLVGKATRHTFEGVEGFFLALRQNPQCPLFHDGTEQ